MIIIIAIAIAYLLGSISSAILVAKITGGPDPRKQGSGNAGATNVLRLMGKKQALWVFIGDALKGVLAIWIAKIFGLTDFSLGLVAIAVVAGHIFPVFFQFKGGKGVATAVAALFAMNALWGAMVLLTWLLVLGVFRYSSLAALISIGLSPVYALLIQQPRYFVPAMTLAALIIWKHQANIKRLRAGIEPKVHF